MLEFIIRVYPNGLFSGYLDTQVAVGDQVDVTGPFGVFTLRDNRDNDLVFVGGGAGMAPILSLLRSMAERGLTRKATFSTARGRSRICASKAELHELEEKLGGLHVRTCPVQPGDDDGWDGETGLITDVVKRHASGPARRTTPMCADRRRWWRQRLPLLTDPGRGGKAHLLRQVHDHWLDLTAT